jgi:hypothetical protein
MLFIDMTHNWTCKHCKTAFEFNTVSEKANHSRWCKSNPQRGDYIEELAKRDSIAAMNVARKKSGNLNGFFTGHIVSAATREKLRITSGARRHTPETKKKMSAIFRTLTHRRLMRHTQKYKKLDGSEVLMDSSWEVALATRLDSLGVEWIRPEPLPWVDSLNHTRNYFSDFYLPKYDVYLDPKNSAAYSNQIEKIKVISAKYPNVKILRTLKECEEYAPY